MPTLDQTDLDAIGKEAKNSVRVALDSYEIGAGHPLQAALDAEVDKIVAKVGQAIYQRDVDDNWFVWEKIVQGSEKPEGMTAVQLNAALIALIKKAVQ